MKFSTATKDKEVAYITHLLSIFGIVEVRQMRMLFSHLSDAKYGKIMARLHQEGLVFHDPRGKYLSTSRYALNKAKIQDSVRTFWAFIKMKDKAKNFCSGEPPALISFSTGKTDCDMIPVNAENIGEVVSNTADMPENVRRLLIVTDMDELDSMTFRPKNDYVMEVSEDGNVEMYKM